MSINTEPTIRCQNDLLAFIKILFLYLKRDRQEMMIQDAKKVLMDCATKRKAEGAAVSLVPSLHYVLEHHVRLIVGEEYWLRSRKYFAGYQQRHLRKKVHPV